MREPQKAPLKENITIRLSIEVVERFRATLQYQLARKVTNMNESINNDNCLWIKDKNTITDEEYTKHFEEIAGAPGKPWVIIHGNVEGAYNYIYLFYIPHLKPSDYTLSQDIKSPVKLYVNRVYLTDEAGLLPSYLRFVVGLVDSYDLPLNISREVICQSYIIDSIKKYCTKKIIAKLISVAEVTPIEYIENFWCNFGLTIKEGLCQPLNTEQKDGLLKLSRFYTTRSQETLISLDDYLARMQENQQKIYYANGETTAQIMNNQKIDAFVEQHIEVLFLVDKIDELWVNIVGDFCGFEFESIF